MSGRIRSIKPEWLDDELLAGSSDAARVLSVALLLLADDHGNGRGHVSLLAAAAWPYHSRERLARASEAVRELMRIGFVRFYRVAEQTYFQIRNWGKHQKVDHPSKPRVPPPESATLEDPRDSLATTSPAAPSALAPDLRSGSDPDQDQDQDLLLLGAVNGSKPAEPALMDFPVTGAGKGGRWSWPQERADSLQATFPLLDVPGEARKAKSWLESSPSRQKTGRGMPKFLYGWMERAANSGKGMKRTTPYAVGRKPEPPSLDELTEAYLKGELNGS